MGVVQVVGYQPQIISTEPITSRMSKFTLSDAIGYCYSDGNHQFYVISFPTSNATFVYDVSTQMWHERSTYISGSIYQVNRHLSNFYVKYNGMHLVSDYASGNLYSMSTDYYSDNGQPIVSFSIAPYVYDPDEMENVFISKLIIDAETGVADAQDTDPQIYLSWSDDGGHTWSNNYQVSIGQVGQYRTRLMWRRVGRTRNRVFRLTISSPVKKVLINSFVEAYV
jgi:Neuraminidase (sialidase)